MVPHRWTANDRNAFVGTGLPDGPEHTTPLGGRPVEDTGPNICIAVFATKKTTPDLFGVVYIIYKDYFFR